MQGNMHMSRSARLGTAIVALVLAVPVLGITWQDEPTLEAFHKRTLAALPLRDTFWADPVTYFRAVRSWVSDRVYPIIQVTQFEKRISYRALGVPPAPRITIGKDGHVFVNGATNSQLYRLMDDTCVRAHQSKSAHSTARALTGLRKIARRQKTRVDVIVVPAATSIYGDALPDSVPDPIRRACLQRTAGISPLLSVKVPTGVGFTYPLREMLAARGDEAFFPRGNWHPAGLSLKVVRDTYLGSLGHPPPAGEALERGTAPAELLFDFGVEERVPIYFLRNAAVSANPERNAELRAAIAALFKTTRFTTHVYENVNPVLDETVLMLSDSFGDLAAEAFAGAFRQLIQVNTNVVRGRKERGLFERVRGIEPIDRVLILVQEGNVGRISRMLR
jgi:hypothetical protein